MKHLSRISFLCLLVFIASLFIASPALAIPPLPSSFYGNVKVNSANVPDGTLIQALIGGQVYAEGYTQTYQGNSVYALDVRGDDSGTATVDGGREADTIQFKIGGVLADQTAVWHAATNVNLNLSASTSAPILTPQATPTPVPTQTAIVIDPTPTPVTIQPTTPPTIPAAIGQASLTPALQAQSSPTHASPVPSSQSSQSSQFATRSVQSSPVPAAEGQSSPLSEKSQKDGGNVPYNNTSMIVVIVLIIAVTIGFVIRALRKNM